MWEINFLTVTCVAFYVLSFFEIEELWVSNICTWLFAFYSAKNQNCNCNVIEENLNKNNLLSIHFSREELPSLEIYLSFRNDTGT